MIRPHICLSNQKNLNLIPRNIYLPLQEEEYLFGFLKIFIEHTFVHQYFNSTTNVILR